MVEVVDPRGLALRQENDTSGEIPSNPGTIVVLDNSKANADALFSEIVVGLEKAFPHAALTVARKPSAGNPCPADEFERIVASRPELIITGTGD